MSGAWATSSAAASTARITLFQPTPKLLRICSIGVLSLDIATAARVAARLQTAPGAIDGVHSMKFPQPSTHASSRVRHRTFVGPTGDGKMTDRVSPPIMHTMTVQHPAAGARLHAAGQLDMGDELVVVVGLGVGQDELGQGKQQLAPPLDRGRLEHAYGLGRSDGFAPRASRRYVSSPSIRDRVTHYRAEDPV